MSVTVTELGVVPGAYPLVGMVAMAMLLAELGSKAVFREYTATPLLRIVALTSLKVNVTVPDPSSLMTRLFVEAVTRAECSNTGPSTGSWS